MKNLNSKVSNEKVSIGWLAKTTITASALAYFAMDDLLEIAYQIKGEEIPFNEYGMNLAQGISGALPFFMGVTMIIYKLVDSYPFSKRSLKKEKENDS